MNCVSCHGPEGWGQTNGTYPQIAGQLAGVIIKQLEDIRRGNRSNPIMRAFTAVRVLHGAQEIADVAAYVASLPTTPQNGQGRERQTNEEPSTGPIATFQVTGDRHHNNEELRGFFINLD